METEVGLRKEFKQLPKEVRSHANGVAALKSHIGYIFIDAIVSKDQADAAGLCWLCSFCHYCRHDSNVTDFCEKGKSPIEWYVRQISRVTLHELLHLCGCDEEQVSNIDDSIHPFRWDCGKFSPTIINLIEL